MSDDKWSDPPKSAAIKKDVPTSKEKSKSDEAKEVIKADNVVLSDLAIEKIDNFKLKEDREKEAEADKKELEDLKNTEIKYKPGNDSSDSQLEDCVNKVMQARAEYRYVKQITAEKNDSPIVEEFRTFRGEKYTVYVRLAGELIRLLGHEYAKG